MARTTSASTTSVSPSNSLTSAPAQGPMTRPSARDMGYTHIHTHTVASVSRLDSSLYLLLPERLCLSLRYHKQPAGKSYSFLYFHTVSVTIMLLVSQIGVKLFFLHLKDFTSHMYFTHKEHNKLLTSHKYFCCVKIICILIECKCSMFQRV